jgi:hypothetical protein
MFAEHEPPTLLTRAVRLNDSRVVRNAYSFLEPKATLKMAAPVAPPSSDEVNQFFSFIKDWSGWIYQMLIGVVGLSVGVGTAYAHINSKISSHAEKLENLENLEDRVNAKFDLQEARFNRIDERCQQVALSVNSTIDARITSLAVENNRQHEAMEAAMRSAQNELRGDLTRILMMLSQGGPGRFTP